jgi:hypothetical protein
MGKIKIAPNYSVFIDGVRYDQNETVEVEDTSKYIGKKYVIILEESNSEKEDKKETSKGNRRRGKKENKEDDEIEDEIEAEDEVGNK